MGEARRRMFRELGEGGEMECLWRLGGAEESAVVEMVGGSAGGEGGAY